jgi:tetratricopeptide (TPR) repeat protein
MRPPIRTARASAPLQPQRRNTRTSRLRRPWTHGILVIGLFTRAAYAADPLDTIPELQPRAGSERAIALNEEGSALYAAADYRRAAERFLQAYAVDEDPNLLFNIASCYEALGDIDAALEKYRAFLAAPNADPEGHPRAAQAIARLTELESLPVPTPQPPPAPAPARSTAAAPTDTGARDARWVPWVGLSGGLVLGALGATFYWMGAADHAEVTDAPGFDDRDAVASITRGRADELVRTGDTKKAIGVASASAGVALIVGSVVWWLVDPMHPTNTGLGVTWNTSDTGLHFSGAF